MQPSIDIGGARAGFGARIRILVLALLLLPAFAFAQGGAPKGNPRLASLAIEVWPEYDRPAALVILKGALADDVKLPAAVTLRLPAASGGAAAVAYSDTADGNLLNLKHEFAKAGEYVALKFDAPTRFFHIEFYEPIATTAPARSFRYVWPGDLRGRARHGRGAGAGDGDRHRRRAEPRSSVHGPGRPALPLGGPGRARRQASRCRSRCATPRRTRVRRPRS